ncbi:hypothetical protein EST38_g2413 [Candolleomyces aberdarensis]|uniref:Uncharacterized protein n=1 Tax=Candolleomyces aberdarensis TaxID=2316362 RepID=A0A4Q2DVL5_9AGAR|nr:hypothetical protein EST38_g2413 [Candolleomyces aberdarensis]
MVQVTVQNTLGAVQIGTTLAVFLFGLVTLQYHHYSQLFEDDRRAFKLLAGIIWLLELLHTICIVGETYRGTILFYGNLLAYQRYPFMGAATMLGGLITMLIHLFFSLRVWKVLPNPFRYIGGLTGLAATVRGVASVYLGIRVILAKTLQEYRETNGWLIRTLLLSGAIIDVVIALSMLWFLISKRERDLHLVIRLVDHLVAYTVRMYRFLVPCMEIYNKLSVGTGLLTSLAALSVLITFQVIPETFVWVGIYVVLAKRELPFEP